MELCGKPVLKFRTKDKLHISKVPGFLSWASAFLLAFIGVVLDIYFVPEHILLSTQCPCFAACLILGLCLMEQWEDFVIDREENLVTIVTRSWYHRFSLKVPEKNVKRFTTFSIISVLMNPVTGIDILQRNGDCCTIAQYSTNNSDMLKLRKDISTFLHLERLEDLEGCDRVFLEWDVEPLSFSYRSSDNEESDNENQENTNWESKIDYVQNLKILSSSSS